MNQQLEHLQTSTLAPYARNSRTHSPEQIQQICASITEYGFTNPVLIDAENGIIAGHGRVEAAKLLNLPTVPCLRLGHLTPAQKRAYIIADNKLAENSGWNYELLRLEVQELHEMDYNTALLGFGVELQTIMADPEVDLLPPPVTGDKYKEQYGVVVMCAGEKEQAETYRKLHDSGYTCKVVTV